MSTRVGTVQAPKAGGSILLAVFLTSLVMLTVAVVAISLDSDQGRQGEGETTFVGRHVVNTPTELSGGIIGGPAASFQGIIAGSSSIAVAATPDVMAAIIAARDAAEAESGELSAGTTANTPSELSGGVRHKYVGEAVGANTPSELSGGMGNGLPPEFYDRHQRG